MPTLERLEYKTLLFILELLINVTPFIIYDLPVAIFILVFEDQASYVLDHVNVLSVSPFKMIPPSLAVSSVGESTLANVIILSDTFKVVVVISVVSLNRLIFP